MSSLSKILIVISVVVASLAIVIGTIGQVQPQLFFQIPNVGFILWAMTGNPVPPYFDQTPLMKPYFHQWTMDGDIIIASMPKAGTVWLHNIVHLLKHDGNDDKIYERLFDDIGTTEMLYYPEHNIDIRIQETNDIRKRQEQQQRQEGKKIVSGLSHFTHLFPRSLDKAPDDPSYTYGLDVRRHSNIKYIVAMRNPKEVARSFYPFMNEQQAKGWREMWGGFPFPFPKKEDVVDFCLDYQDFVFGPALAWWKLRKEPNVLLVNFVNLKTDISKEIKRIATFLDIDVLGPQETTTTTKNSSEENAESSVDDDKGEETLLDIVVQKSSFEYMKKREETSPGVWSALYGRPDGPREILVSNHLNQGVSGNSDEFFTPEMSAKFDEGVRKYLREYPDLQKWLVEGGPTPGVDI